MAPPKTKTKKTREEILERKREAERARYARLKNNPEKYEQQKEKEKLKYLKKKEKGTRKLANNMTPREHRTAKKKWKNYSRTYRSKQKVLKDITNNFLRNNTPSNSDIEENVELLQAQPQLNENKRQVEGRKRASKQRRARNKMIIEQREEIAKLKSKLNAYRKKIHRFKKNKQLTPKSKVESMVNTPLLRKELVKKALFGEVIKEQLKYNYNSMTSQRDKKMFNKVVSGDLIKKYKIWRNSDGVLTYRRVISADKIKTWKELKKPIKKNRLNRKIKETVERFFEEDCNSRLGAGKKETITLNKIKKQKRYLQDSMLSLHKKFLSKQYFKISYATFCRLRPFWVVVTKISDRDTCMCTMHANIDLLLAALFSAKILPYGNYQKVLEDLCCDRFEEKCLKRICFACRNKALQYLEFHNDKKIPYKQWVSSQEEIVDIKTKKTRLVRKYRKKEFSEQPKDVILKLEDSFEKFFKHEFNIVHQYHQMKALKENLTEKDAIVHMDFSENYATKYNQEVQSFHFGGSRTQISMHTVVVYLKGAIKSYCTLATNLNHNASAIWAHLKPVLLSLPLEVENVHFLSDGPVTQYRNKIMFYILGCKLFEMYPRIIRFSWNYHETGHGKGAPDGIGAVCKRTADKVVAAGGDVSNFEDFVQLIQEKCPGIKTFTIPSEDIEEMDQIISQNQSQFISFPGTLQVHQVTGSYIFYQRQLIMRSASCFCSNQFCEHYKIGNLVYPTDFLPKLNVDEVYTDSEKEEPGPSNAQKISYTSGEYLLVKFLTKKTEYRYIGICSAFDEDDGEIRVTFLKICNEESTLFRVDENDVAYIGVHQVIRKLETPKIELKGNRVFYKFKNSIDVFEK